MTIDTDTETNQTFIIQFINIDTLISHANDTYE